MTLMEHLRNETKFSLSLLFRIATKIEKELKNVEDAEAVLLWVEFQAVTQVMIQQLALYLDPAQSHTLGDIQPIINDINL